MNVDLERGAGPDPPGVAGVGTREIAPLVSLSLGTQMENTMEQKNENEYKKKQIQLLIVLASSSMFGLAGIFASMKIVFADKIFQSTQVMIPMILVGVSVSLILGVLSGMVERKKEKKEIEDESIDALIDKKIDNIDFSKNGASGYRVGSLDIS